jgi:hypothetical protein
MFKTMKTGARLLLANGMKATVTEITSKTFLAIADGGAYRAREYGLADGKTIDPSFNVQALLNESKDKPLKHDFRDGKGSVAAHNHKNADGTYGGIVADTAFVCPATRVGIGSQVGGTARVTNSILKNNASVTGNVEITNAVVDGDRITPRQAA